MGGSILIVTDQSELHQRLSTALENQGLACQGVSCARGALAKLSTKHFSIAFIDLALPDMDGIELFKMFTQLSPNTSVFIVSQKATLNSTIAALRLGAFDYIDKETNSEEIVLKVKRLLAQKEVVEKAQYLHKELNRQYDFANIVAVSKPMSRICELIRKAATNDSTVLITGKSGTGKTSVARTIHFNSLRRKGHFVPVNCCAIPDNLVESELFGYKKGAFTNAIKDKEGLFNIASKGTIFFDGISCMSPALQAKLLRAIEFKSITPIGALQPVPVDVRIIASSHEQLDNEINAGRFREDLFYRINVFEIAMPSLCERREDIPLLVRQFISKFCREMAKPVSGISQDALEILYAWHWHGELRELENVIERAMIFCENDMIAVENLPEYIWKHNNNRFTMDYSKSLRDAVNDFEKHFIIEKLKSQHGHRTHAYKALQMSKSSFYRKLQELNLQEYASSETQT